MLEVHGPEVSRLLPSVRSRHTLNKPLPRKMIELAANNKKYGMPWMKTVPGWFLREESLKAKSSDQPGKEPVRSGGDNQNEQY